MKLEQGDFCPFIKAKCKKMDCMMFLQMRGSNPQTGAQVDEWDCALRWQVMLTMENTNAMRGTQKATESFRNEMVDRMDKPFPRNHGQLDLIDSINRAPKLIGAQ